MNFEQFQAALQILNDDALDAVSYDLVAKLWPQTFSEGEMFDEKCEVLEKDHYWFFEVQFRLYNGVFALNLGVYLLDEENKQGKYLRGYELNHVPKWLVPLVKRAGFDPVSSSYKQYCNTYWENLDGSPND